MNVYPRYPALAGTGMLDQLLKDGVKYMVRVSGNLRFFFLAASYVYICTIHAYMLS